MDSDGAGVRVSPSSLFGLALTASGAKVGTGGGSLGSAAVTGGTDVTPGVRGAGVTIKG